MSNIIATLEKERMQREVPDFGRATPVVVEVKVRKATASACSLRGVVIAKSNRDLNSSFTVRKISTARRGARLPDLQPVARRDHRPSAAANVRRAKLYYLRERTGKAARIEEKV